MSHELIYTSVPQGLKAGSKGFCTVAMTAGMTVAMAERLESLSGYRTVYDAGDPQANKNPVAWAHWRISFQGKNRSVLSRVSFAGFDYSQRTNKLAHHVVVEPAEQCEAGPAWLMLQPGFMETTWNGAPRTMPTGRVVPRGTRNPSPCNAWAAITGDAGWAGILAEAAAKDLNKPAYIIFNAGTELLPLFEEAMSLLPVPLRWQITFNCYFTELPMGLSCHWRGVVAGSQVAKDALKMGPRALVIDLTQLLGKPNESPMVITARTGRPAQMQTATSKVATATLRPRRADTQTLEVADDDVIGVEGAVSSDDSAETKIGIASVNPEGAVIEMGSRRVLQPVRVAAGAAGDHGEIPLKDNGLRQSRSEERERAWAERGMVSRPTEVPRSTAFLIAAACLVVGVTIGFMLSRRLAPSETSQRASVTAAPTANPSPVPANNDKIADLGKMEITPEQSTPQQSTPPKPAQITPAVADAAKPPPEVPKPAVEYAKECSLAQAITAPTREETNQSIPFEGSGSEVRHDAEILAIVWPGGNADPKYHLAANDTGVTFRFASGDHSLKVNLETLGTQSTLLTVSSDDNKKLVFKWAKTSTDSEFNAKLILYWVLQKSQFVFERTDAKYQCIVKSKQVQEEKPIQFEIVPGRKTNPMQILSLPDAAWLSIIVRPAPSREDKWKLAISRVEKDSLACFTFQHIKGDRTFAMYLKPEKDGTFCLDSKDQFTTDLENIATDKDQEKQEIDLQGKINELQQKIHDQHKIIEDEKKKPKPDSGVITNANNAITDAKKTIAKIKEDNKEVNSRLDNREKLKPIRAQHFDLASDYEAINGLIVEIKIKGDKETFALARLEIDGFPHVQQ